MKSHECLNSKELCKRERKSVERMQFLKLHVKYLLMKCATRSGRPSTLDANQSYILFDNNKLSTTT